MEISKFEKLTKVMISINIILLIIFFTYIYYNMNNLINSNDSIASLIGIFGSWVLPYITIDIFIQIIVAILIIINKNNRKILNIISLILEIIYFLYTTFWINIIILGMLSLFIIGNVLATIIVILFEIINITILVLIIKKVVTKRNNIKNQSYRH